MHCCAKETILEKGVLSSRTHVPSPEKVFLLCFLLESDISSKLLMKFTCIRDRLLYDLKIMARPVADSAFPNLAL